MADPNLIISIGAKADKFNDELDKIKKRTKNLEKGLSSIAKISGIAFAGLSASIGLAVKDFTRFDNELRGVKTLLNENSFGAKGLEKGFNDLKKEVLDLGAKSSVSLSSLNKALFDTVSAGIEASDAVDVLDTTSRLAVAGLTEVSIATDGVTSALNAYGLGADQAENVASKFFQAQVEGKTTIEELSRFFGRAGATASAFGVSLDELLGSVSAVTAGGVRTRAAFTGLNAALANISKPTKEASEEAERLGIAFDSNSLRAQGLTGFLNSLTNAQGFTKESVERLFGSIEAQKLIFALTGEQAEKYKKIVEGLGNETETAATFNKAYETQSKSLENQLKSLSSTFEVFRIEIGERLAPTVGALVGFFGKAGEVLRGFDDKQKENLSTILKWGAGITGIVAAGAAFLALVFKVSAGIGALTAAGFVPATVAASGFWVALTGPVGLAIAGIVAVGAAVAGLFAFLKKDEPPKSLQTINKELEELRKKEQELEKTAMINRVGGKNRSQERLEEVRREISELERLANIEGEKFEKALKFGNKITEQKKEEVEKTKETEDKKAAIVDLATQKRIQALKNEKEILALQQADATNDEIEFLKRRQDLQDADREARAIKNQEERTLALENIKAQRELLAEDEREFNELKDIEDALRKENQLAATQAFNQLSLQEQKKFENQLLIEKEKARKKDLINKTESGRLQQSLDQKIANNQKSFARATGEALIAITGGSRKASLVLSKGFAIADVFIKDGTARASALAAALSASAAAGPAAPAVFSSTLAALNAAITKNTALSLGTIAAQTVSALAANRGGEVPFALGARAGVDSVPALLTPGELIVPQQNFNEVIEATARQRNINKDNESKGQVISVLEEISGKLNNVQGQTVINGDVLAEDSFIDTLIEKINDRLEFGNAQLRTNE